MIKAEIFRNENNKIYGFQVKNHGAAIVCSAVSLFTLNCVNCIEKFTDCDFSCEYNDKGGFLKIEIEEIKNGGFCHDADLIFECLLFGLMGVEAQYAGDIKIFDKEVHSDA